MLLGTLWELGNSSGTYPTPWPPQKKEKRNWIVHECMLSLLVACMKFLFRKLLVTIFGLGYWHGQKFGDIVKKKCI
jgi:hypothetical protein